MMIKYKIKNGIENKLLCILRSDGWAIPFNNDNVDYSEFKLKILNDEKILEDVDGNEMTAQQAKDFVKELP